MIRETDERTNEMSMKLEHVNVTVPDPDKTAGWLCDLFGWHVRWTGTAINGGYTVHVGDDDQYLALYTGPGGQPQADVDSSYAKIGGLNHIGVVVEDLDAIEAGVKALGYETYSHADYEPGRRFYFNDENGIEFEMVSYG